jgi:hypothetical protein
MIAVHTLPKVEPDPRHGWQLTLWVGKPFDYTTPFRAILVEVAALADTQAAELSLPPYAENEDFIEGTLTYDGHVVAFYYEHSLGYLSFFATERELLDDINRRLMPFVSLDRPIGPRQHR